MAVMLSLLISMCILKEYISVNIRVPEMSFSCMVCDFSLFTSFCIQYMMSNIIGIERTLSCKICDYYQYILNTVKYNVVSMGKHVVILFSMKWR